jgi:hypothetical protein
LPLVKLLEMRFEITQFLKRLLRLGLVVPELWLSGNLL